MTGKQWYREQCLKPEWQKKRLEVMNRDGFICMWCGCTGDTLNVHHWYYASGRKPWEYPDEAFITVCEGCHKTVSAKMAGDLPVMLLEGIAAEFDMAKAFQLVSLICRGKPIKDKLREMVKE